MKLKEMKIICLYLIWVFMVSLFTMSSAFAADPAKRPAAPPTDGKMTAPAPPVPAPALSAPSTPAQPAAVPPASAPVTTHEVLMASSKSATEELMLDSRGALNYLMPSGAAGTFEANIEKITLKKEELPETLTLASVAKMKTNPYIATTQADFTKISKEAFRKKLSGNNWRIVQTSFYSNKDGSEDTLYIIIAMEYNREKTSDDAFQRDVNALKKYMKSETSDEYVLIEKFPFIITIASNQNGDYEFSLVKELAERLKFKIFGTIDVKPAAVNYDFMNQAAATAETAVKEKSAPAQPAAKTAAPASAIEELKKEGGAPTPEVKQPVLPAGKKAAAQPKTAVAPDVKAKPAQDAKAKPAPAAKKNAAPVIEEDEVTADE